MDKYKELKSSYNKIINIIHQYNPSTDEAMVEKFLLSISLRIWSCNAFYANEYGEVLKLLTGKEYSIHAKDRFL